MRIVLRKDLTNDIFAATVKINRKADIRRQGICTPGVPYAEKEIEAKALIENAPDAYTPYLLAEAAALNIDVRDLAKTVIAKAETTRAALAEIEADRRATLERIKSARTPAEIASIIDEV